jgi:subtilase family serine protease
VRVTIPFAERTTFGGYGLSALFAQPGYQSKFYSAGGRSVPDVAMESTPGIAVCQATAKNPSGCYAVAGTSLATPLFAGVWALVSQAWTDAFHSAKSMGSDFAHVGLGSARLSIL